MGRDRLLEPGPPSVKFCQMLPSPSVFSYLVLYVPEIYICIVDYLATAVEGLVGEHEAGNLFFGFVRPFSTVS